MSEAPNNPLCANCGHPQSFHSLVPGSNGYRCSAWFTYAQMNPPPAPHQCYCDGFVPFPLAELEEEPEFVPRRRPFEISVDFVEEGKPVTVEDSIKFTQFFGGLDGFVYPPQHAHVDFDVSCFRIDCMIDDLPGGRRAAWTRLLWSSRLLVRVGADHPYSCTLEQRRVVCEECLKKAHEQNADADYFNPNPGESHPEVLRAYVEFCEPLRVPWRHLFEVQFVYEPPPRTEPIPIAALRCTAIGASIELEEDPWP